MRVDYTLPSLVPETLPELPGSVEGGAVSFRDQLRAPVTAIESNWQEQFRLESRPPDATYIPPPPKPRSMEVRNIGSERNRWRKMLSKHYNSVTAANSKADGQQPVSVMLEMLFDMQGAEDEIVSQNAALTRG